MHLDFRVQRLAHQGAGQRRVDADQVVLQVELVGTDDAVARGCAFLVLEGDPGAEVDLARIAGALADHLEVLQALAQKAHAAVDLAQHLLAVGVLEPLLEMYYFYGRPRCGVAG